MSRANAWEFIRALKSQNAALAPIDPTGPSLVDRPKRLFNKLERLGFALEYTTPQTAALQSFGFEPKTVFDIGVHAGTPLIYNAFPDAHFVLADPVAECENQVARWKDRISMEFHCCAVGAAKGSVQVNIPTTTRRTAIARASVLEYAEGYRETFESVEKIEVPVRTLDDLAKGAVPPFGIKIDTEGYELEVIKGARKTLKDSEFVLAEVSVRPRFEGGYRFSEFVAEMGKQGFEPLDFMRPIRPDSSDCDLLFARYDSELFALKG